MKAPTIRILERVGGGILVLAGIAWLVLGLSSLSGESFVFRAVAAVVLIALLLLTAGGMLAKPKSSTVGRVLATVVCVLGTLREFLLMSHHGEVSLMAGGWIGIGLISLYAAILILVVANHFQERRTATA